MTPAAMAELVRGAAAPGSPAAIFTTYGTAKPLVAVPAAASVFGDLDFDLREATIDHRETAVTVLAAFGNADVYVPEGVNVDVGGITVFGHHRDWGRDAGRPDAPTVHVRVLGLAGTVDVWRVPHDMQGSSYSDIFRQLEDRRRELPS